MTVSKVLSASAVGVGRACGKAILIGEHFVVYGSPAIAVPLPNLTVEATVSLAMPSAAVEGRLGGWRTGTGQYRIVYGPRTAGALSNSALAAAIEAAMRQWHIANETVEVLITSRVPPARGLGFSAACATAVVRALSDLVDAPLNDCLLRELVQTGEQMAHGQASGVDAAAVAAATPIRFEAGLMQPIVIDRDLVLVVADTGATGSTRESVARVGSVLARDRDWAAQKFAHAAALVKSAELGLLNARLEAVGERLSEFHCLLREFSISTPEIEGLVEAALAAGAYGAKLTGGGMGGCVVALSDSMSAEAVCARLEDAGAQRIWTASTKDWAR
jgi:mevalonate kinase